MNEERIYKTHQLASLLSISDGTLRKWCIELEKQGYVFEKDEKEGRSFSVRDYEVLMYVKHLLRTDKLTITESIASALTTFDSIDANDTRSGDVEVVRDSFVNEFKKLNEHLYEQSEMNKLMLEQMEKRDENLMIVLNELLEHKKEIASTKQVNKKWWQFWK